LWQVLGPVASPIPRIKDRYRFQCVVKYSEELDAAAAVRAAVDRMQDVVRQTKLQISVDVDPQVMM
jgi:primosomal protein N' (replication factor Y)